MDELEAMRILKKEVGLSEDNDRHAKKLYIPREVRIFIIAAVSGFLLLTALYYVIVHPVDRLAIKLMLNDNSRITTTVVGSGTRSTNHILVDGNLMQDNKIYYEIGETQSYKYTQGNDGRWYRQIYRPKDDGSFIVAQLFNKDNYVQELWPWAAMKYKGNFMDLDDVRISVTASGCTITGKTKVSNGFFSDTVYVTVKLHQFGWINIDLPKNYFYK